MKVRVEEDTLARLRLTAREWGVPGWYEMTSCGQIKRAIEDAWRAEASPEQAKADHAAFLRSVGLRA